MDNRDLERRIAQLERQIADLKRSMSVIPTQFAINSGGDTIRFGKLTAELERNGMTQMDLWSLSTVSDEGGVGNDLGQTVDVFDAVMIPSGKCLPSNTWVWAIKKMGKFWVIQASNCPDDCIS